MYSEQELMLLKSRSMNGAQFMSPFFTADLNNQLERYRLGLHGELRKFIVLTFIY